MFLRSLLYLQPCFASAFIWSPKEWDWVSIRCEHCLEHFFDELMKALWCSPITLYISITKGKVKVTSLRFREGIPDGKEREHMMEGSSMVPCLLKRLLAKWERKQAKQMVGIICFCNSLVYVACLPFCQPQLLNPFRQSLVPSSYGSITYANLVFYKHWLLRSKFY